jgi:hypothetical protein
MRKFMFAALAGVFMLSSGFTPTEKVDQSVDGDYYNCRFVITTTYMNMDGTTGTDYNYFTVHAGNENDCQGQASSAAFHYNSTAAFVMYSN